MVYISYNSKDKAIAKRLEKALTEEMNVCHSCNEEMDETQEGDLIKDCELFIFISSEHSNNCQRNIWSFFHGYKTAGKSIIVRIDISDFNHEIRYTIKHDTDRIIVVDAFGDDGFESAKHKIQMAVKEIQFHREKLKKDAERRKKDAIKSSAYGLKEQVDKLRETCSRYHDFPEISGPYRHVSASLDYILSFIGKHSDISEEYMLGYYRPEKITDWDGLADQLEEIARNFAIIQNKIRIKDDEERQKKINRIFEEYTNRDNQPKTTFEPSIPVPAKSQESGKESQSVFSSIFAPAEIAREEFLLIQVYLHLEEETEKVLSLSKEADKDAVRRTYEALKMKLEHGDTVDIEMSIYSSKDMVMNENKSLTWEGRFTKCSFDWYIPEDLKAKSLLCVAKMHVKGLPVGEMKFITKIMNYPQALNAEIKAHMYKKIFISYSRYDLETVRNIILAYKSIGVDYFFDIESLRAGDVYDDVIFDYIKDADLFYLCWSANAAQSEYVNKERAYAMSLAYPQISQEDAKLRLYPVIIKPWAEIPEDMQKIYTFKEV